MERDDYSLIQDWAKLHTAYEQQRRNLSGRNPSVEEKASLEIVDRNIHDITHKLISSNTILDGNVGFAVLNEKGEYATPYHGHFATQEQARTYAITMERDNNRKYYIKDKSRSLTPHSHGIEDERPKSSQPTLF